MTSTYESYTLWCETLNQDAVQKYHSLRLQAVPETFMLLAYQSGIRPNIEALKAFSASRDLPEHYMEWDDEELAA